MTEMAEKQSASDPLVEIVDSPDHRHLLSGPARKAGALIMSGISALGIYAIDSNSVDAQPKYPSHTVMATVFWIGEPATAANGFIDNESTAWVDRARKRFGGIDNPKNRNKLGLPAGFRPKENPYYIALPVNEFNENGLIKGVREASPWAVEAKKLPKDGSQSLFKGRWIEVIKKGINGKKDKISYGQWVDSGPFVHDPNYVFGSSTDKPKNQVGLKAAIDLSPSLAFYLNLGKNLSQASGTVTWRFADRSNVPKGPWTKFPSTDNKTHWDD